MDPLDQTAAFFHAELMKFFWFLLLPSATTCSCLGENIQELDTLASLQWSSTWTGIKRIQFSITAQKTRLICSSGSVPTCRSLLHTGSDSSLRWLCTHLPKCCRQVESDAPQVWWQEGHLRRRQLEQEVCWQEPRHAFCSRETDLREEPRQVPAFTAVGTRFRWGVSSMCHFVWP